MIAPLCNPNAPNFVDGVMLTILFGLPLITVVLYAVFKGVTVDRRAERRWQRVRALRAAALMAAGMNPDHARAAAEAEMAQEASDMLREEGTSVTLDIYGRVTGVSRL